MLAIGQWTRTQPSYSHSPADARSSESYCSSNSITDLEANTCSCAACLDASSN